MNAPPPSSPPDAGGVAAVDRALRILMALGEAAQPQTLAELSRSTGLYKSTLLRILASLERHRFTVRQPDGLYRLGPAVPFLSSAYGSSLDLRLVLEPALRALRAATNESASFFIREGDRRICLHRVDSPQEVRDHIPVGTLLPLQGAAGHVLVEFADGARAAAPLVISSYGERSREIAAVASPVFDRAGRLVGAVCVSGTRTRFDNAAYHGRMCRAVLDAAQAITAALDGDLTPFQRAP